MSDPALSNGEYSVNMRKTIVQSLGLVAVVFIFGTVGFHILLEMSMLDAFYLTVITLTTVGYGDMSPHSNAPDGSNPYIIKFFAIILILFGMSAFLYVVGIVTEYIVSGEMGRARRMRVMRRRIARLSGHYIVCGVGGTGRYILQELEKTARPFVAIDLSAERLRELAGEFTGLHYLQGDATDERLIQAAGLDRARGVILTIPNEKDVLFTVISLMQVREKDRDFRIVARASDLESAGPKLLQAGADRVVSPADIAGKRLLSEMFRPAVTTFLDRMLQDSRAVMRVEEAIVSADGELAGKTLAQSNIREQTGMVIVAIRRAGEKEFTHNPPADYLLRAGDSLVALGAIPDIVRLRNMAEGRA